MNNFRNFKNLLIVVVFTLFATSFCTLKASGQSRGPIKSKKTQFWFVKGYESYFDVNLRKTVTGHAVFSPVVRTHCEALDVEVQFDTYYKAYYSNLRGYSGLVRKIAFGPYQTWAEAEKKKREILVQQSRSQYPEYLYLEGFSYLCEDL